MSDMLGISSNAISAYQRALSTVSNNIANVNTEGYSRQDVVLKDSAPKRIASMYVGTGVLLQNIKRQYDAFAESNLRNSTSDLSAQTPMVDYTKRVMDIMGDKNLGLSAALDNFFGAAGSLSADPASTVLRTSFLRNAEGVGSRFAELSGQLDLIATETQQGLESVAAQVNTLTSQLALINQSMARSATLEGQPAELLDRRDLALRQLSDLVRIKTNFSTNGTVSVSLGASMKDGVVVDGQKARPIGIDRSVQGKTEFVLDPYGATEALPAISGGLMGGYQAFISQVLEPAQKNLNALAQTFVDETNAVQRNGIDGYGAMGQDLFAIDASETQTAAGVRTVLTDGMRIATAAQFRVTEGTANVSTAHAAVKFTGSTPTSALSNSQLVNNPNPTAGVTFKVDGARVYTPVTSLSAGVGATFYMDEAEPGQQLQVLTRDGRQLLGRTLTETEKYQLMTAVNGFEPNAVYSDKYLNQSDSKAYRGLDMFYGAKAGVTYKQSIDTNGATLASIPMAAMLETGRISNLSRSIAAGALHLNGVSLSALNTTTGTNAVIAGLSFGSSATAPFSFKAQVGGTSMSVSSFSATTMAGLAAELQTQLRLDDGNSTDLSVSLTNNGADLVITDARGRDITNLGFSITDTSANASVGEVDIQSPAQRMAAWLNGSSQAELSSIQFGTTGTLGFSDFSLKIAGLPYDIPSADFNVTSLQATTLDDLAAELQTKLRTIDESAAISVVVDNGKLIVNDKLGRVISDVKLTPASTTSGASEGVVTLTQSVTSQSHVRAEVVSSIQVPVNGLNFGKSLILNGKSISPVSDVAGLVSAIHDADIGLKASVNEAGELVIEDPSGSPITVNTTADGNALNTQPGTYGAQIRMVQVARDWRIAATELDFTRPLEINGQEIVTTGVTRLQGLVDAINAKARLTGVVASIDENNDLKLSTTDVKGTASISIGPGKDVNGNYVTNALRQEPLDYDVTHRLKALLKKDPPDVTETNIRLSFGTYTVAGSDQTSYGSPADLAELGLRTGAYIEGGCPDDLLLFVTGQGAAKVAVGFEGQPDNPRDSLRSQSLQIKFTAADRYSIIDTATGTELADRYYDPSELEPVIDFEGLQIKLSHAPSLGDTFMVDGNQDGLGNNVNMLEMVDLGKKGVVNGKTLNHAYIDQINNIGNLSQQAIITQEALKVVNDQAVAARDKVSGVNLDDEAAALVRYQQAYQAAAKALQVSSELFDAIAQIS